MQHYRPNNFNYMPQSSGIYAIAQPLLRPAPSMANYGAEAHDYQELVRWQRQRQIDYLPDE